jgi:hypothetical protein
MGDFFLNGCKEEYFNCKFPAFNPGKMIERQAKGAFMNNIFFDDFLMRYGGWWPLPNQTKNRARDQQCHFDRIEQVTCQDLLACLIT